MSCSVLFTIVASLYIATAVPVIHSNNKSAESGGASETQLATCRVVTDKIVATASATVTRALKGICTAEELENNFVRMKNEIKNQLEPIKLELKNINRQLADVNKLASQENKYVKYRGPRDTEIKQHNYTVHSDSSGGEVFSYFWKVDGINDKLSRHDQHVAIRSPSFYVKNAYRMYVKLFPPQTKGNIYINVGLVKGQFDNLLAWPFKLKHRVMILDQTEQSAEDLSSRVWDPASLCSSQDWQRPTRVENGEECVGFGFTKTAIYTKHYVFQDCILIKLDVFLP